MTTRSNPPLSRSQMLEQQIEEREAEVKRLEAEVDERKAELRKQSLTAWIAAATTLTLAMATATVVLLNALNSTVLGGIAVVGAVLTIVTAAFKVLSQATVADGRAKGVIEAMAAQTPLIAAVTGAATVMSVVFEG